MRTERTHLVNEVTESFTEIQKSIESLKKCSNKDFKVLAVCFDKSVKSVSRLVNHSKSVFSLVERESSDVLLSNINELTKNNEHVAQKIRNFYLKIKELKTNSAFMQNLFLVYLENCIQDFKTFNFLSKSSRFVDSYKNAEYEALFEDMRKMSLMLSSFLREIYKIHVECKTIFDTFLIFFEGNSLQTLGFEDDPSLETKREIQDKRQLVKDNFSVFSQRESSHTNYYSEIVTNLQYNDIITQKIEHVSEIITDVSLRLKHVSLEGAVHDETLPNVKKAVELQSAQLVQINLDYQEALKVIFKRLEELSDNASDITTLTVSFCSKHGRSKSYFSDIISHLTLPGHYFEVLTDAEEHLSNLIESINSTAGFLNEKFKLFDNNLIQFQEMKGKIDFSKLENDSSFKIVSQKLQENVSFLASGINSFSKSLATLSGTFETLDNSVDTKAVKLRYRDLIDDISVLDTNINADILETTLISRALKSELDSLIGNVGYYSLFEKEVEKISLKLTRISEVLSQSSEDMPIDNDFFNSLKQYYTMKSEHDVHDTVLLVDADSTNDFDDVEFF